MVIYPNKLKGKLRVPPSKSIAHRALICAGLARGRSEIYNLDLSDDIGSTLAVLQKLGVKAEKSENCFRIQGGIGPAAGVMDCGESGSTLRFMIPVALLTGGGQFAGRGRLMERPLEPYFELFQAKGIAYTKENLTVQGSLSGGIYPLRGDVSSQFISGLLFALPLVAWDSRIQLTTDLESKAYVELTLDMMRRFGVVVKPLQDGYEVPGGQAYQAAEVTIEGDYSQAAFFLVANALGSDIQIEGLNPDSLQGDRVIVQLVKSLQAPGTVELDVSDFPDLVPVLTLLASQRDGEETRFCRAGRLRMKESDRLTAMEENLRRLGVQVLTGADWMKVTGRKGLEGGAVQSYGDHRIAMTMAIAAAVGKSPLSLDDGDCVQKSYPDFWQEYIRLGGEIR